MNTILESKNLCKTYYSNDVEFHALKNVDLEIYQGEFVAIMGQSGSGKSTLLYTLSGMDDITGGEVYIGKQKVNNLKQKVMTKIRRENIGFIFQGINLVSNLTLKENVVVPGYLAHKSKNVIDERATNLINRMDITDQVDKLPSQVSGGQKQRAAIARAMINNPDILFADEPTGALNSSSGKAVLDLIKSFNEDGQTIIMVTHDIKSAAYANRVVFLKDGRIEGELNLKKYQTDNQEKVIFEFLSEKGW
ncbi:MAG: ABC transporter ATP-binding protein [Tenericutes bacterium]|jgi:putative ABC transport system ATP-binding protein|nr:ABC transporter ATP-binding protein [Mycoplasmatota bacterium]